MHKITMTQPNNLTVTQAFNQFIQRCKIKNLSDQTILSYQQKLKHFFDYSTDTAHISQLSKDTVDNYILWLRDNRNCNDITINSYLRSLRAFLYYCMECGYLPTFKIQMIKAEKKMKETYSDEELRILLAKPDINTCTFREYEVWTLENYLVGTGNRISSAMNLKIKDIDFSNLQIIIRKTKNRSQYIIPLSHTLSIVLRDYLVIRGGESDDYVFCNTYGNKGDQHTFQQAIRTYNRNRGVAKSSCHLFRHTFAKNWILSGGDIFRLQKIFGHSDITVTKEYLTMFGTDLQMDFEKYNPLDRLNRSNNNNRITMK